MSILRALGIFIFLTVAACGSPRAELEKTCRQKAGITIYDAAAWMAFIAEVKKADLRLQQSNLEGRRRGTIVAPADIRKFVRPFPYVPGYEHVWEHTHYYGQPQPGSTPQSNDETIAKDGRKIGTLHDFEVTQHSFGTSSILTCSNSFPELYEIRRTTVLQ